MNRVFYLFLAFTLLFTINCSENPKPSKSLQIATGSVITLNGGSEGAYATTDQQTLHELVEAKAAKDKELFLKIFNQGNVVNIENGTKARVLVSNPEIKLHILYGEHKDKIVWTTQSLITP